ncbi:fibronectin type III domain-containing protein [Chryseobacterium artocarpi]|uniref:fibronectin type III domain-containing protein n=1 Tax=Chryseobacterium artocarpi TaxID=1414727 RepID=UPI003F3EC700
MKQHYFLLKAFCIIIWGFLLSSCFPSTSAAFPYRENFSTGNGDLTFVNGSQTNKWMHGSAVGNPPNAIYISNTNGNTNAYNVTGSSIVHTYRDIAIPAGTGNTIFSFDWRAGGESTKDYLRVWLAPSSFTPAAGTSITAGAGRIRVGNDFNMQTAWQTYINANLDLNTFAGADMRLIFEWVNNNNGGTQPPASIDNISLGKCFFPTSLQVSAITPTTAILSWAAPASPPADGYEYYISTANTPPDSGTTPTGTTSILTANLSQLSTNTTYYWWVRSACSTTDKSIWVSGGSFSTPTCDITTPVITVSNVTHNSATLRWARTNKVDNYQVRYRPVGALNWTITNVPVALPPLTVNTFDLTNLLSATLYEVEIAAVCNGTTGIFSHDEFVTKCDPTPPVVTISSITSTSALITWSPLAASATYVMRWREVGTIPWNQENLPAPPANTFTLTNLGVNKTYEVQIANQCIGGTLNPYSHPKVFTTERECQTPPSGLTITQLLPTWAEIKWDPFPGATYILRYRKVGIPSWTEIPTPVNNLILNNLTELTKYEMQVANICNGTPGNYTPMYYFTTPTVGYCQMISESSAGEHISKITVKPNGKPVMENSSGASNYTNYTGSPNTFIELIQGSVDNEIIIDKKWTGNTQNEGVAVWIDFNRNGDFDIDERILVSSPNSTSPISGRFNVPANASVSMTSDKYIVMRVAMERDGVPVSCTKFKNGEVEDYKVIISKKGAPNLLDQNNDITIYPNPVHTVLHIKNISQKANYKLYSLSGQLLESGIILHNKIDVSKLVNSVYVIYIDDNGETIEKKFIKE